MGGLNYLCRTWPFLQDAYLSGQSSQTFWALSVLRGKKRTGEMMDAIKMLIQ
jgi:hypothetical protein